MGYFPFFIDIENKNFLIVGGGKVAYRKIKTLLEFKCEITVVAQEISDEILKLEQTNKVKLIKRKFELLDLDVEDLFCVISATNDKFVNNEIAEACKRKNIFVNIADDIESCNFIFPAVIKKEDIIVGVSTSGNSPIMSKTIKDEIAEVLPECYAEFVTRLGEVRAEIKNKVDDENIRKSILKKVTILGLENDGVISNDDIEKIVSESINGK